MRLTKQELKDLPNSPAGQESKKHIVSYVGHVMTGMTKTDALKLCFPERYERAMSRAKDADPDGKGKGNVVNANLSKEVNQVERSRLCKDLYNAEHKDWWIKFLVKKQKGFEILFDLGQDKDVSPRERINALNTMLTHLPEKAPDAIKVEHSISEDDFKSNLLTMKKKLFDAANEAAIDVEVVEVVDGNK